MGRLGRAEPLHDIDVEVYNGKTFQIDKRKRGKKNYSLVHSDLDAVDRMSPPLRRERLPDYDELLAMYAKNKIQRVPTSQPSRAQVSKRPVASYQTQSHQAMRKAGSSGMRMDQYYQEESEEEEDEEMEMEVAPHQATKFMGRSIHSKQQPTNVFRRVQNPAPAPVRAYVLSRIFICSKTFDQQIILLNIKYCFNVVKIVLEIYNLNCLANLCFYFILTELAATGNLLLKATVCESQIWHPVSLKTTSWYDCSKRNPAKSSLLIFSGAVL